MDRKVLELLTEQVCVCAVVQSRSSWGGNCVETMHLYMMKAFKYTFKSNN